MTIHLSIYDRLYEGGGGQLWYVPAESDTAIRMAASGDFLTDCRTYEYTWDMSDVHPDDRASLHTLDHGEVALIATYDHGTEGTAALHIYRKSNGETIAGKAGQEYLSVDLLQERENA